MPFCLFISPPPPPSSHIQSVFAKDANKSLPVIHKILKLTYITMILNSIPLG